MVLRSVELGSVLLVGPEERPSGFAVRLAEALVPDPGRLRVVAEPDNGQGRGEFWSALADLLRGRGPIRLALPGAGSGRPTPYAQWLADRIGTEIVAPDGVLAPVGNHMVYVAGGIGGYGTWAAFRPGQRPVTLGPRFPQPRWERGLPPGHALPSTVESIPAGMWLRGHTGPHDTSLRGNLFGMPFSFDNITIAVGSPDAARSPAQEFGTLRRAVPMLAAPSVRIVPYWHGSTVAVGQELADLAGERVVTTIGVPGGGTMFLHDRAGRRTWEPFALEVAYLPGGVPAVTRWRPPLAGLAPRDAVGGVFPFGSGMVLEVVQSGLWLRGAGQGPAPRVRALPADPEWVRLTVGVPGEVTPDELMAAASTVAARLDPRLRHYLRLSVAGPDTPGVEPRTQAPVVQQPVEATAPAPAPASPVRQVVFPAVDPRHRSSPEEQSWLMGHLGTRYGRHSSAAVRLMASQPALRLLADAPKNAVVADLVAVSAYLAEGRSEIDTALADGRPDVAVPYLHCVVSGLRRLPSYRGVVLAAASLDVPDAVLAPGTVWTEAEFRQAFITPDVTLPGPVEFVIWSTTARRLEALEPEAPVRRVVFAPGSRFQVLDGGDSLGPVRRVLLRQVTAAVTGVDTTLRDRLAAVALRRHDAGTGPAAPDGEHLTWHVTAVELAGPPGRPEPVEAPSLRVVTTGGQRTRDDSALWDAGSAEFLPLLAKEG